MCQNAHVLHKLLTAVIHSLLSKGTLLLASVIFARKFSDIIIHVKYYVLVRDLAQVSLWPTKMWVLLLSRQEYMIVSTLFLLCIIGIWEESLWF